MNASRIVSVLLCGTSVISATNIFAAPGLWEARYAGSNNDQHVTKDSYLPNTRDRVVLGPYAANAWGEVPQNQDPSADYDANYAVPGIWPPDTDVYAAFRPGWHNNTTFYYTGYIHIPDGSNTVTFAASFDDAKLLRIDDNTVIQRNITWDAVPYGTATLATGWHKFDFWMDNGDGGFGPPGGSKLWHPARIGFGIDWEGRNSNNSANFVFPADPGDGSLFQSDPPEGYATVKSNPALQTAIDAITLPAAVTLYDASEFTLRVYYGLTNEAIHTSQWMHSADASTAVSSNGTYGVDFFISAIEPDTTYHYRHALINNSTGEIVLAPASLTFTFSPAENNLPSRFGWLDTAFPVLWSQSQWENLDNRFRSMPGVAGDTLAMQYWNRNGEYKLDQNLTVGRLLFGYNDNPGNENYLRIVPAENSVVTLTFDPGPLDPAIPAIDYKRLGKPAFGLPLAARHDDLTIHLEAPFHIHKTGSNNSNFYIHTPITGGSPSAPTPIHFVSTINNEIRYILCNTNNTFYGDIYVQGVAEWQPSLYIGFHGWNMGEDFYPAAVDSIFGDPANKIILRNKSALNLESVNGAAFARKLLGTGWLLSQNNHGNFVWNGNAPKPLLFTDASALSPGEDDGFGTLKVFASELTFDPASSIRLKVNETQSDAFQFSLRYNNDGSATVPGVLNLNNVPINFEPVERIRSGARWLIGSCEYAGTTVNGRFASATPHFLVATEINAGSGIAEFYATFVDVGSFLMIR